MSRKKINGIVVRNKVLQWLETMRLTNSKYGSYKLSSTNDGTIMSSCFAVFVRELFDDLKTLTPQQRKEWVEYIKSVQDFETGLFIDPQLERKDLTSVGHDWEYVVHQTTAFALSALDAFGTVPDYVFTFLRWYKDNNNIIKWLESMNWLNPWLVSNNVMFIMQFLTYESQRNASLESSITLDKMFRWLNKTQDPKTGYWGTNKGANILNGMAGAFHIYIFYCYFRQPLKHISRIIDTTLSLQNNDGLFSPKGGGGACEDLDAIDILVLMSLADNHRSVDIKNALKKAFYTILANQNEDGGFYWAKRNKTTFLSSIHRQANTFKHNVNYRTFKSAVKESINTLINKNNTIKYSGWSKMKFNISKSDVWSTWFRPLALALISSRYPGQFISDIQWKFRRTPGLGWHIPHIKNRS